MNRLLYACLLLAGSFLAFSDAAEPGTPASEFIRIAEAGKHFVRGSSDTRFIPWGFNYDHDANNRLLEDYWEDEWDRVAGDFREIKALGGNTVRIHLQVGRFMTAPDAVNAAALGKLTDLVRLAESNGLYLVLTGLGCYDKPAVPEWYNALDEQQRWKVQARFWEAIAQAGRNSPAIFCYDLMNEPVVTENKTGRDWTPGAFGDRYFVQRITLDFKGRSPRQIAAAWVKKLTSAIRKHDQHHLMTVGAIPWALTWPSAKPLFYSAEVGAHLDFVSVHFYPKAGEIKKALEALAVYDLGKPIVIEEMFPLHCSVAELGEFIDGSQELAAGWIGFYWGKTIPEYRAMPKRNVGEEITLRWLEYFRDKTPEIVPAHARN